MMKKTRSLAIICLIAICAILPSLAAKAQTKAELKAAKKIFGVIGLIKKANAI